MISVKGMLSFNDFDLDSSESNPFFDSVTAYRQDDQREYRVTTLNFTTEKSNQQSSFTELYYKLADAKHPNLAQYNGFSLQDKDSNPRPTLFATATPSSKTIESMVDSAKINITEYDARTCIRQIADAIAYLHSKKITVGWLTRKSIVMTEKKNFILRDYGFLDMASRHVKRARYSDHFYCAPELFNGRKKEISNMTDVWAFGTLMYELLKQSPLDKLMKPSDEIPEGLNCEIELIDLIKSCRAKDPKDRPTFANILEVLKNLPSFAAEGQTLCYKGILEDKCQQGDVCAMNELAECYMEGKYGFAVNSVEGIRLYKQAADQGHAEAMSNYGVCLQEGEGIDENLTLGFEFIKKSAENGSVVGKAQLGVCYVNGHGTKADRARGMKILKEAADNGNAFAQVNYGIHLQDEKGKSDKGGEYLAMAATQDDVEGLYNYGVCYLQGDGAPDDKTMAARLFRKAAVRGHAESQIEYAKLCRTGMGVEKNLPRARAFLLLAICQGMDEAIDEYRKFAGKHVVVAEISGKTNIESVIRHQISDPDERYEILRALAEVPDAYEEKRITKKRIIIKKTLVLKRVKMSKVDIIKLFGTGSQSEKEEKRVKRRKSSTPSNTSQEVTEGDDTETSEGEGKEYGVSSSDASSDPKDTSNEETEAQAKAAPTDSNDVYVRPECPREDECCVQAFHLSTMNACVKFGSLVPNTDKKVSPIVTTEFLRWGLNQSNTREIYNPQFVKREVVSNTEFAKKASEILVECRCYEKAAVMLKAAGNIDGYEKMMRELEVINPALYTKIRTKYQRRNNV